MSDVTFWKQHFLFMALNLHLRMCRTPEFEGRRFCIMHADPNSLQSFLPQHTPPPFCSHLYVASCYHTGLTNSEFYRMVYLKNCRQSKRWVWLGRICFSYWRFQVQVLTFPASGSRWRLARLFSSQDSGELLSIRADSTQFRWTKGMIWNKAGSHNQTSSFI